jgi:hypothetical protein
MSAEICSEHLFPVTDYRRTDEWRKRQPRSGQIHLIFQFGKKIILRTAVVILFQCDVRI